MRKGEVMNSNILVADDLSIGDDFQKNKRSYLIRKIGCTIAKRLKDDVDLLFVENFRDLSTLKSINQEHERNILRINEAKNSFEVPVRTHMPIGSPASQIISFIDRAKKLDMVVLGTEGRRGLKNLFLGSVAEDVIKNSNKPVMVIGPEVQAIGYTLPEKIKLLVATDLSETSGRAEEFAMQLASRLDADVTLVYSLWEQLRQEQEAALAAGAPYFLLDDTIENLEFTSIGELKDKVERFSKKGIKATYKILSAPQSLSKLIINEVQNNYDLVIMGTKNRNKLIKAFIGSYARRTILESPVPVVVVHS